MKISVMLLVSIVFLSSFYSSYGTPDFFYHRNWKQVDFDWQGTCKDGKFQSPVNIDTSALESEEGTAYFDNYDKTMSGNMSYEHHVVKFTFNNTDDVGFVSVSKSKKFRLHSMHFHWDCTEHSFNNKSYNMELHLVHYDEKIGSFNNVEQYSQQGISVIGVLFKESSEDNEVINSVLNMIRSHSIRNTNIKYRDLLPAKLKRVYQYSGSLTTPPCHENVLWHVLDEKSTISLKQLREFKELHPKAYFPNCRQVKPLNGRKITSIEISAAHSFVLKFSFHFQICVFAISALLSKYFLT